MKRLLMGIVVVGIMLSAGVGSAQQSGSSPELQKWAATHCGQWTGTGHTKDTPMGPGGRWTAKMSVQPLLNGVVVEETYEFDFEGAAHPVRARGVLWYDPARERLVHVVVAADGVVQEGVHTQDTTGWEATSIRTDRSYKVRGSDTHAADGEKFTRRGQMSLDGKNWLPLFEAEFTKVAEISGATTDDEQELIRLEEAFCDAVVKKDVAMVDRLLGEDLTLAMADAIHTKDQAMAYLQSEEFNLASLDPEDLKARIYGDMGVVTGELRWSASDGECGRDRITDIWLKRNGRWQMVATQQSEIEKTVDSAKLSPEMKRLAVFAGDWTYEGEQLDPPGGGPAVRSGGDLLRDIHLPFCLGRTLPSGEDGRPQSGGHDNGHCADWI